ncbi:30S ribosomal protein S19 [Spirochaetota bacterium]|nr:30S ribosomal protein S19 [Spirochaetota bacterium]
MARSVKKGPYISPKFYKKVMASAKDPSVIIRTYSRSSMIFPEMIGKTIHVHNGKTFIPIKISDNQVGHKLGEFAPTRLFRSHSGDKKVR